MLRFIICCLYLGLYLILGIPVLGVEWILGKINKEKSDLRQLRMVQWGFKCMLAVTGVEVTGDLSIAKIFVSFLDNKNLKGNFSYVIVRLALLLSNRSS
mgnify:CR=1 FL=1